MRILPAVVALLLLALPAFGQFPRDANATKKIREAIDSHYLATDFDKAEAVLVGIVEACEDQCNPQVLATAWMYVGIVRGSGKNDVAGAKQAFEKALALDRSVNLDLELATAEAQKAFQDAGGGLALPQAADTTAGTAEAPAAEGKAAGLACTPEVSEVETRRPIPVECRSEREAATIELRFKPPGEDWQSLTMRRAGDGFRAQIPCDKTHVSGRLVLFVRAKDASGDEVARWGTKAEPITLSLVETSRQAPPSFEDADPPARCAAKEDCPPNFPGCASGEPEPADEDATPLHASNWLGLHLAQDLTFVGGTDICTQDSQNNDAFACYYGGSRTGAYVDDPYPGATTDSSLVVATTRILLSYEHALASEWLVGGRVGYAFGGGPPSGRDVVYDEDGRIVEVVEEGLSFLPFHVEARVSYWFGDNPLARRGLRPYVHAGGGLAQVDAKVENSVKDCGLFAPFGTPEYDQCASGEIPENDPQLRTVELDAWKKRGQGFVTLGGGLVYAFTPELGAQLNLNLMYMLPGSGFVIEPSLGAVFGF